MQSVPIGHTKTEGHLSLKRKVFIAVFFIVLYVPFLWYCGKKYLHTPSIDFPSFYYAGRTTFVTGNSPYGIEAVDAAGREYGSRVYPFFYPPTSLFLFFPCKYFSYETGRILMLILNHILVLILLWVLLPRVCRIGFVDDYKWFLFLVPFLLFNISVILTIRFGQINLFLLVLLSTFWILTREGRLPLVAAMCLAGAIMTKTYYAPILAYLFIRKRYRCAIYTVDILLAFSILGIPFLPAGIWGDWFTKILPNVGYAETPPGLFSPSSQDNISINGFTGRLFLDGDRPASVVFNPFYAKISTLCLVFAVAGLSFTTILRSARSKLKDGIDREISTLLFLCFAISPFSWGHSLAVLIPALFIRLRESMLCRPIKLFGIDTALTVLSLLLIAVPGDTALRFKVYAIPYLWLTGCIHTLRSKPAAGSDGIEKTVVSETIT